MARRSTRAIAGETRPGLGGRGLSGPVTINDYNFGSELGGLFRRGAVFERLGRVSKKTGKRGKGRVSIEIEGEPIIHEFDELVLGQPVADAIARVIRGKIENISKPVSETHYDWRIRQGAAWERGEMSHEGQKRYTGGRIGTTPPPSNPGNRYFNHSGRFKQVSARENKTDKNFTINVPANRLDDKTFGDLAQFERMTDKLQDLVPELEDPARLARSPMVRHAIELSVEAMIQEAAKANELKRAQRLQAILGVFRGGAPPMGADLFL